MTIDKFNRGQAMPTSSPSIPARVFSRRWLAVVCAATLGLAACDRTSQLEEGVSTEMQVRQEFGDPTTVTVQPDGTRVFDYPRQPEGFTNYVIIIAADGKVSSIRQLLTPDNFAKVTPGLTQQEVRNILGREAKRQRYDLKKEEVWSWRFKQDGLNARMFNVTFSGGQVTSTEVGEDPRESQPH